MKIKTSDLTGAALDWAVAECNLDGRDWEKVHFGNYRVGRNKLFLNSAVTLPFSPSTDWSQGVPIIEREKIYLMRNSEALWVSVLHRCWPVGIKGSTPLIAAMRCYVASKLGSEVEVPDELLTTKEVK